VVQSLLSNLKSLSELIQIETQLVESVQQTYLVPLLLAELHEGIFHKSGMLACRRYESQMRLNMVAMVGIDFNAQYSIDNDNNLV